MKKHVVVLLLIVQMLFVLTPELASANRFTTQDEISIDEAIHVAVSCLCETCSFSYETVYNSFEHIDELIDADDGNTYWLITLSPIPFVSSIPFKVLIDAHTAHVIESTTSRYAFHYGFWKEGIDYTDWFEGELRKEEEMHGNNRFWDYKQLASFEERCHGWMYLGCYQRYSLPDDGDLSFEEACLMVEEYLSLPRHELTIIGSSFEVEGGINTLQTNKKYWNLYFIHNGQLNEAEIEATSSHLLFCHPVDKGHL